MKREGKKKKGWEKKEKRKGRSANRGSALFFVYIGSIILISKVVYPHCSYGFAIFH